MFIQFNSYFNQPINIQKSLIISVEASPKGTEREPLTIVTVAIGTAKDEWFVRESVQSVLSKLNTPPT